MANDVPTSNSATHAEIKTQRTICQRFIANSLPSFKRARRSTHGRATAGRLLSRDPFTVKRKTLWVKGSAMIVSSEWYELLERFELVERIYRTVIATRNP